MPTSQIKAIGCRNGKRLVEYVTRSGKLYSEAVDGRPVDRVVGVGISSDREGAKKAIDDLREARKVAGLRDLKDTEAWHFVQSFDPTFLDETKAEDVQKAHILGLELARKLEERYRRPILMATHTDAKGEHVHNHFVMLRTGTDGKALRTDRALLEVAKELNDKTLAEYGIKQDQAIDRAPEKWQLKSKNKPLKYVKNQVQLALLDAKKHGKTRSISPWEGKGKKAFGYYKNKDKLAQTFQKYNLQLVQRGQRKEVGFRIIDPGQVPEAGDSPVRVPEILPQEYVKKQVKAAVWDAQSKGLELAVAPWDKDKKRTFEDTPDAQAFDQILAEHNLELYRWRQNRIGFKIRDTDKAERDGVSWLWATAEGEFRIRTDHFSDRTLGAAYSAESVRDAVNGTITLKDLQKASEAQKLNHMAKRSGIRSATRQVAEARQRRYRELQRGWVKPGPVKPVTASQKASKRREAAGQEETSEALEALKKAKVSDAVRKRAAALVAGGADVGAAIKAAQVEEQRRREIWRGLGR